MFVFQLEETEANLVIGALAELPFKVSAGLIGKLQGQAKEQLEPKPAPEPVQPEAPLKIHEVSDPTADVKSE